MNTQNNVLFAAISKEETKEITHLMNETSTTGFNDKKSFTAADLWNIQRQKRSTLNRRHF